MPSSLRCAPTSVPSVSPFNRRDVHPYQICQEEEGLLPSLTHASSQAHKKWCEQAGRIGSTNCDRTPHLKCDAICTITAQIRIACWHHFVAHDRCRCRLTTSLNKSSTDPYASNNSLSLRAKPALTQQECLCMNLRAHASLLSIGKRLSTNATRLHGAFLNSIQCRR